MFNRKVKLNYITRRILQLIPIIIGITFMSFALMRTTNSDVVDILLDNNGSIISEEKIAQKKEELGLNRPFIIQYLSWLTHFLQGDMGVSYVSKVSVFDTFISKLPNTLLLTFSSIVLTMIISIPLGILSAIKQNSFIDYLIRFISFVGNAMPNFFVSLILLLIFAVKLSWLPVIGNSSDIKSLFLPTLTLAIAMSSKYIRQVRAVILDELQKDYVIGARARGVKESVIILRNVLKVAMLPIITLLSLSIGSLLGGTAIVETIFMWDGVGKMAVDAVMLRDNPVLLAYVVWMAIIYVVINLINDIFYYYLDPRVRITQESHS